MRKLYIVCVYCEGHLWGMWTADSDEEAQEIMSDNHTFGDFRIASDTDESRIYVAG